MRTITCTLTFPGGNKTVASVSAATPYDRNEVSYTGEPLRSWKPDHGTPALLEALFKNIAAETGSTLSISFTGEYDQAE